MKKIIFILIFANLYPVLTAQGELDTTKRIFFRNEKTWGLFIFTNGWGGNFRHGKRINASKKFIWETDINYIRHTKEVKVSSSPYYTSRFVYGKVNLPLEFRGSVGYQKELFRKIDKTGVAVRVFYVGGPSIVLLKPIYYQVGHSGSDLVVDEKFDINSYQIIYGRSSFFKGIDEIQIDPGIYLKAGFTFDFSKKDNIVNSLEIGGGASAFLNEVTIMAAQNSRFLFNLFVSYRFGRVIRGSYMKNIKVPTE